MIDNNDQETKWPERSSEWDFQISELSQPLWLQRMNNDNEWGWVMNLRFLWVRTPFDLSQWGTHHVWFWHAPLMVSYKLTITCASQLVTWVHWIPQWCCWFWPQWGADHFEHRWPMSPDAELSCCWFSWWSVNEFEVLDCDLHKLADNEVSCWLAWLGSCLFWPMQLSLTRMILMELTELLHLWPWSPHRRPWSPTSMGWRTSLWSWMRVWTPIHEDQPWTLSPWTAMTPSEGDMSWWVTEHVLSAWLACFP